MPKISELSRLTAAEVTDNEFLLINAPNEYGGISTKCISVDDLAQSLMQERLDNVYASIGAISSGGGSGSAAHSNSIYYHAASNSLKNADNDNIIIDLDNVCVQEDGINSKSYVYVNSSDKMKERGNEASWSVDPTQLVYFDGTKLGAAGNTLQDYNITESVAAVLSPYIEASLAYDENKRLVYANPSGYLYIANSSPAQPTCIATDQIMCWYDQSEIFVGGSHGHNITNTLIDMITNHIELSSNESINTPENTTLTFNYRVGALINEELIDDEPSIQTLNYIPMVYTSNTYDYTNDEWHREQRTLYITPSSYFELPRLEENEYSISCQPMVYQNYYNSYTTYIPTVVAYSGHGGVTGTDEDNNSHLQWNVNGNFSLDLYNLVSFNPANGGLSMATADGWHSSWDSSPTDYCGFPLCIRSHSSHNTSILVDVPCGYDYLDGLTNLYLPSTIMIDPSTQYNIYTSSTTSVASNSNNGLNLYVTTNRYGHTYIAYVDENETEQEIMSVSDIGHLLLFSAGEQRNIKFVGSQYNTENNNGIDPSLLSSIKNDLGDATGQGIMYNSSLNTIRFDFYDSDETNDWVNIYIPTDNILYYDNANNRLTCPNSLDINMTDKIAEIIMQSSYFINHISNYVS